MPKGTVWNSQLGCVRTVRHRKVVTVEESAEGAVSATCAVTQTHLYTHTTKNVRSHSRTQDHRKVRTRTHVDKQAYIYV